MKPFFVYMLRCSDGSYYVGHTDELEHRVASHQAGDVEGYTQGRRPVELVWAQETANREEALSGELRIKGWSRAKKEALIARDWDRIKELAKSGRGLREAQPERDGVRQATHTPDPVPPQPVGGHTLADPLHAGILRCERRAIAKAITLLESTRADHRKRADTLLNTLLPHTGKALRIGISGVPGVGKSTFIEALGLFLIDQQHRVAVLTIDPSSTVSGGSILGDKTRMERLSVNDAAYIRPSPASGTLGGVAEKTREAMLVCEAAGYDIVIVETVGVGQSEIAVASMTDMFVLLQLPNAGDDLQAIKKGVMELADLVVINKADIDPDAATRAQATITSALRIFSTHGNPGHWTPKVMQISALKGQGIADVWQRVQEFHTQRKTSGEFDTRRKKQALAWTWDIIHAGLQTDFRSHPAVRAVLHDTLREVIDARLAPSSAARTLLDLFERS
jgi:LAO/AO transport system kinase